MVTDHPSNEKDVSQNSIGSGCAAFVMIIIMISIIYFSCKVFWNLNVETKSNSTNVELIIRINK